jgi:ketosteroid isomerase-like protein
MSRENVEVVRGVFDAEARRDAAAALALYDPDVEFDTSRGTFGDVVGRKRYHGHEGLRSWFRDWYEAWENVEADLQELIDAGENVISVEITRARGKGSGVQVELTQYGVWTITAGKIVRSVWFTRRAEALEAAGLRE